MWPRLNFIKITPQVWTVGTRDIIPKTIFSDSGYLKTDISAKARYQFFDPLHNVPCTAYEIGTQSFSSSSKWVGMDFGLMF